MGPQFETSYIRRNDSMKPTRGQSEVLGVVLLLSLSLATTSLVVALGSDAIGAAQSDVQVQSNVDAMERFDSRSAPVAFGDSGVRTVDLGRADGQYDVRSSAGWIRITHTNATDAGDETVYNETLGAVVYRSEGVELAYQGGAVWRRSGGWSRAISPPEFHYRGKTLTLPIVRTGGTGAASGRVQATVTPIRTNVPVYPNASRTYDGTAKPFRNPVRNGSITATVRSDYYQGWARYFRSRTTAQVTNVDHANETTSVKLVATEPIGNFEMPRHGNAIELRGLGDEHAIDRFNITLEPDSADEAHFANADWRLEASEAGKDLTIGLFSHGRVCSGSDIDVRITFSNATTTQRWEREDAFSENATDFAYDCSGEDPSLHVNFTGTSTLSYVEGPEPLGFNHTEDGEPATHEVGDNVAINQLLNHYVAVLDSDVDLVVKDGGFGNGNGNGNAAGAVDEQHSFGTIQHERSGPVVTFLRITENRVRVDIE